jgi:cellobiose phosphorylase
MNAAVSLVSASEACAPPNRDPSPAKNPLPYRFNDAQRSIAITRPDLPAPWINYLSNGNLHAFTSHAAGGCLWWRSPINYRISRYRSWMNPGDGPGFSLYVREQDGTAWSPSWMPTKTPLEDWRANHAPGRTTFTGKRGGQEVSLTLFIAPDTDALVWDIAVTNHGSEPATADLFGYVELGLLEWLQEYQWGYYVRNMLKTWWDADAAAQVYLYHHQNHPFLKDIPLVYFAADRAVASATGDRQRFLGAYRTERDPLAVQQGTCGGGQIWCGDPCAALQVKFDVAPGATERAAFFLGLLPHAMGDFQKAKAQLPVTLAALRAPGWVAGQREKLEAWWAEHFSAFDCRLPDADIERQVRTWSPVNSVHTGRYSRSFSQNASGLRGFGYRDTAQDMLAIAYRRPEWAHAEFLRLLRHQFADGHAVHTYFPEDKQPPWRTVHSDDHLWLPMVAHALVAETGNLGLLDERVPFLAENGVDAGPEATVWGHLQAALDFTENHLGTHGIPLTLHSDWNDCIGRFAREGRGESVFAAQQYVYVLRQMLLIADARGDAEGARRMQSRLQKQIAAITGQCWDGEWWVRGFEDDGKPIGSKTCYHGTIWLNSQNWAVLADVGTCEQQTAAMDAVHRILNTGRGIKKLHPSFPTYPEDMDAFVGYSLGCGENGAIFCHANTWSIIAEVLLGRADRAWEYFRQLVPHLALQRAGLDRYQGEPYAWASSIIGPENPRFGWANITHVTGTAAWMDLAATQYLLGLRPEIHGLRVAPQLPPHWEGFTASRRYRGCRIEVEVRRARPGETIGLALDGRLLPEPLLPASALAGRHSASARMLVPE